MPQACVVSPNPADAGLAVDFLADNGIRARAFASLPEFAAVLDERTGCLILVEEALLAEDVPALREALGRLPAWCDLPLVVVARDVGAIGGSIAGAFPDSGNVALLERPHNPPTLVSAVQVALRAAARQREVGELLAQREHAVKLRDEFLAMLAHELRNPLAPMRNSLYLMRTLGIEEPLFVKSTQILERQVDHVVRMVDDLMDVARLERGKVVLKKSPMDLNRVVAAAVEGCLQATQERGHRISVRFATGALPVNADAVRIEQIVANLVNNAAKFSPEPGGIDVETSVDGPFAVVCVQDRGIGFEPDSAERLFDPFLQVNPTLERSAGGLGMGLTIVRRLAELHGGSVRAQSAGVGSGARFCVRIPLAEDSAQTEARTDPAPGPRRRQRIVVIEDNPDIRESLRMLLAMWGHEVAMAEDGLSGVELVLRQRPEVALIDVGLPGMNGYDVARAIRKVHSHSEMRLVAVTGYGQPSDRELALQAGFDEHVLKPIAPEALSRLLTE